MTNVKRFEDLDCWREARKFVQLVYELARNDRFKRDAELVEQLKRSAISSMANIADGFHRSSTKDFMRFLDYSRASVAETLSHLYVALDQNYIDEAELGRVKQQSDNVRRKVNNFISHLKKREQRRKNHSNYTLTSHL